MSKSTEQPATNQLIDQLPAATARYLMAACHPVDVEFDQVLAEAGAPVYNVLFPTTAIISITAEVGGHRPLEMGMIGFEGMLGASLALGVERHPMRAITQGTGTVLEIPAPDFRQQLENSPALKRAVHGYLFVLAEQLGQTAACNAFHEVSARLARWLLMMDDRAGGQPLVLTHLFLGDMLGVRRSAVTIAAGQMQDKQLIRYSRGHIQVLSRPGLESVACECYPAAIAAYQRQFGCA
ncbi:MULTISPECIES: Crp/Fnr family transcriptional regulator [unclassified Wenzhouxiangella]|uniref:Crp/Fnr family transcriptional regulator n=1 Tax=unclassified Wenzhouxiangella TaxID=2613841 RepID=UPI000E32C598|nr:MULTISPECIES: Crp/Fnr family transcriptional regulator [unclassified Wenzhouxiangella]RFF27926.1 Crp/Fnr family transcriptional regulator [Wenzhouxiangella sp. 15181]RFP67197.1 Crp/Fnr family transcriptional regulator [Wenzhouxiangella sp. 15190]